MLVRIIKNWGYPDLFRQLPINKKELKGLDFTTEEVEKCDFVIILNKVSKKSIITCPISHVWAVIQEPYIPGIYDWVIEGHDQFNKVFTHHIFSDNEKYIQSYPIVPWHINKNYNELIEIAVPSKKDKISFITSNKSNFPGHKLRLGFLNFLYSSDLNIDVFGKGINFIEDKWDALAPYKYSIAIENSYSKNYWTEKISDCFLSFTLPIYYGCVNLEDYFPRESFVRIDINDPNKSVEIIKKTIANNEWKKRLGAIEEARDLILNKYNFFYQIESYIELYKNDEKKVEKLTLKPYIHRISKKEKIFQLLKKLKL